MVIMEADIAKLQKNVERAKEVRSTFFAFFGKWFAKARVNFLLKIEKSLDSKPKLKSWKKKRFDLQKAHKQKLIEQRNGYQREIDTAIQQTEQAEQKGKQKNKVINQQKVKIDKLARIAHPNNRYQLTSGATLVNCFIPNIFSTKVHIFTKVGKEEYDNLKYDVDHSLIERYFKHETINYELVNSVFDICEQVNEAQAQFLGLSLETMTSGSSIQAQLSAGGGGGSTSELPWRDKEKDWQPKRRR